MTRRVMWTATLLLAGIALPAVAGAQGVQTFNTFNNKSERTGYGRVDPQTGRFDTYDNRSNHTGYGFISPGRTAPRSRAEGTTVQGWRSDGKRTTIK